MVSALLVHGVPIECINKAAVHYYVPAKIILSVLETEGGAPGLAKKNSNDTYDYGPMQINTVWLKKLAALGYTREQIQNDPCVNVEVGTWILSQEIASSEGYWQGIGNYNSHTPNFNQRYQQKVATHFAVIQQALGES